MLEEYNFSKAKKNPYAKKLKRKITVNIDEDTVEYFEQMAAEAGIPYQTIINLYLGDCAANGRKLNLSWT